MSKKRKQERRQLSPLARLLGQVCDPGPGKIDANEFMTNFSNATQETSNDHEKNRTADHADHV
jgi:hypothetical protein